MRNLHRHLTTAFALALVSVAASEAQQTSPQQQQRTPEEYAKFLEEPSRVARLQVSKVVAALDLKSGMSAADLGAGSGLFTRSIAKVVAPGRVYAVDIEPKLLAIIAGGAKDAGLSNVETVLGEAADPKLPGTVDLLFICDALHHIANPGTYLKTIRRYLAPGGRVAVIDYRTNWPEGHETLQFSTEQFARWAADAGLTRVASHDWIQDSFFVIYR